jgi:hypothetical protein
LALKGLKTSNIEIQNFWKFYNNGTGIIR